MPAVKSRPDKNSTNRLAFLRIAPGLIHLARGVFFVVGQAFGEAAGPCKKNHDVHHWNLCDAQLVSV